MNRPMMIFLLLASISMPCFAIDKSADDSLKYEQGEIKTGTINSVNIEEHQIVIDDKVIELSDDIKITGNKEMPTNLLSLSEGQQVQYWAHPQTKQSVANQPALPSSIITKIHIITGLKENAYKR